MLSGESAVGEYPLQAVTIQRRVLDRTQAKIVVEQKHMDTDTEDDTQNILASAAALAKEESCCHRRLHRDGSKCSAFGQAEAKSTNSGHMQVP
eukprot:Skav236117  [mRNA]  locus=scaffold1166:507443:509114:+ [translate_table: standard]